MTKEEMVFYDKFHKSRPDRYESRFSKIYYRSILKYVLLPKIWRRYCKVLDVGSGRGFLAEKMCSKTELYVECDVSITALELNGNRGTRINCDAESLPLRDDTFDVVVCAEVIEHLVDPQSCVREMSRVLSQGGVLVVTVPNYSNLHVIPFLLAKAGISFFRKVMVLQKIDRFMTLPRIRRILQDFDGHVISVRASRLHPPGFDLLDRSHFLRKLNDAIFLLEEKHGDKTPLNYLGLHLIVVLKKRPGEVHFAVT